MGELGNDFGERPSIWYPLPGESELQRLPLSTKRGLFDSYQSWLGDCGAADTTGNLTKFSFEETSRRVVKLKLDEYLDQGAMSAPLEPLQHLHEELPFRFASDAGALRSAMLGGGAADPLASAKEVEEAFESGKGVLRQALDGLRDTVVGRGQAALESKVDTVVQTAERRLAETGHTLYQGTRSLLGVGERSGEAAR